MWDVDPSVRSEGTIEGCPVLSPVTVERHSTSELEERAFDLVENISLCLRQEIGTRVDKAYDFVNGILSFPDISNSIARCNRWRGLVYNSRLGILGAGIWVRELYPLLRVCHLKVLLHRIWKSG